MTTGTNLKVFGGLAKCDSEDFKDSGIRTHFSFGRLTFPLNWKKTYQNNKNHSKSEVCPGIVRSGLSDKKPGA